jgi:hypothetical protein
MEKIHSQLMNMSKKILVLFSFSVVLLLGAFVGYSSEQGSSGLLSPRGAKDNLRVLPPRRSNTWAPTGLG